MQRIEYRKGPYFAGSGDFSSAGAADIVDREVFGGSTEHGAADGVRLLAALELMQSGGPRTVPENLTRINGIATASSGTGARGWSAPLMGHDADWMSTDQVPRRLIEGNSVRSDSAVTANLHVSRQFGPKTELTLNVFNLFDRDADDIQYFDESRVAGEPGPVADKHVHPAEPRLVRLSLRVSP